MPLPIAHGLLGAGLVALVHPKASFKNWQPLLFGFLLANAPDLDFGFVLLLGWHGFHRGLTHSLFFALSIAAIFFVWRRGQSRRVPLAYSLAFFSHTILDFTASSAGAVRLLTPFNNKYYGLGLFSISELSRGFLISDMLYFSAIEFLVIAPVFILILLVKQKE